MFGFDDDDGLDGFDHIDFGEARDPTDFITPDQQQQDQQQRPHATSPSPSLNFAFSPIQVNKSLSPAPTSPNTITTNFSHFRLPESPNSASQSSSGVSSPAPSASYRKSKWMPEEDEMLKNSVKIHGTKNWTAVSTLVPGRNPKQCRERWTAQLDPALTRDDWTPQEDATLLHIHKLHGNAWAKIASFLPGRSSNAVKNRFNWLSRRHFPQAMTNIYAQQPMTMHQGQFGMKPMMGMPGMPHGMGQMQQMPMQMQQQAPMGMQMQMPPAMPYNMPRYNSLSPAQCGNFGFSDPSLELPPPRQVQSAAGSLTDNANMWDDFAPFQTEQSPIDELCGDFDWNS